MWRHLCLLFIAVCALGKGQEHGRPVTVQLHANWPQTPLILEARYCARACYTVAPMYLIHWRTRGSVCSEFIAEQGIASFWDFVHSMKDAYARAKTAEGGNYNL